ncbi:dihydrolipoamide acetyltransferase family protein [Streptomyces sp. V4I2]|uniref:dihydrolipoamide acetyltransferase family protein n=1 Tax=Streptomyces sp. V4I2 TaxID=3042280 RepID=UPI0027831858|nr:dihydrolipoamide acetyltransferase family protein [Streptomyces sp. V4I2]MDQ1050988.1 2-oxoisovalerate dehydrogenase E2 component (dihydrolipoyl transacylase) [Streptomyces sp. V4I2]
MTTATLEEQLFRLPDLGEGLAEAEIIEWKVAVGDTVTIDQIVVDVETAKAAVEVPVPYAGTVLRLHAEAGTALAVGEPLITVGADASGGAATADGPCGTAPGGAVSADAAVERYREEEQAGSGNVLIGYGTGHGPATSRRRRRRAAVVAPSEASGGASTSGSGAAHAEAPIGVGILAHDGNPAPVAAGSQDPAVGLAPHAPRVISPLVRRMARDHGIDLAALVPSGPAGVVLRRDVEQAVVRAATQAPTEPAPAPNTPAQWASAPALASRERPASDGPERIPLRGVRRAVADKLSRSRTEIPDATTWVDVDATGLLEVKKAMEAAEPGRRVGLLALLARICVAGLGRYPELNSTVDTERREIVRYSEVHLGFAAQTERGLVVPVVRDAQRMTTVQLAAELTRLTELARDGHLPPDRLTGGTFTLNNYGVFGVDGSTPIINHPEAALLGAGRIVDKPWVVDGALAVRKVMQLSLSFDHRVCDGGVAGGFLRYVADCVERPAILLADV